MKKATYLYNFQHQRVQKILWNGTKALSTTIYHYDLADHLLMETSITGAAQATYVDGDNGKPMAVLYAANSPYHATAQDQIIYLHTDHLGTPRLATDSTKKLIWRWESDAFGSTLANQDPDADGKATVINLRFPGQYYDAESGLHYNWNRYYDPASGRYISSDPIGLRGGTNTFGYVNQKSSSYIDKTGLMTWRGSAIAVSGIVGGGATYLHFNLKSDCINSEEVSVSIDTGGGALGIGEVVTGTTSTVEFEDNNDAIDAKPDPSVFEGTAYYAGIGFAFIGMGYSVGGFRLGDAVSYSFGSQMGWDASAYAGAGFTNIREVERKSCSCECK